MGEKNKISSDADLPPSVSGTNDDQGLKPPEKKEIVLTSEQQAAGKKFLDFMAYNKFQEAFDVAKNFSIPPAVTQQAIKEKLIYSLNEWALYDAHRLIKSFSLSEEVIFSPDVQQAGKECFIKKLHSGNIRNALDIKNMLYLPEEVLLTPEVQQAAKEGFVDGLSHSDFKSAVEIKDKFTLPEDLVQRTAEEELINGLNNGNGYAVSGIIESFTLPEGTFQSPEIRRAAEEGCAKILSNGDIDGATYIKDKFSLPEEAFQRAGVKGFSGYLAREKSFKYGGHIDEALHMSDKLSLPKEAVQQAVQEHFAERLSGGYIEDAIAIKNKFPLPEDVVQQAAIDGFVSLMDSSEVGNALKIKGRFSLPEEVVQRAGEKYIISNLGRNFQYTNYPHILDTANEFLLPEETVHKVVVEELVRCLASVDDVEDAVRVKDWIRLPDEIFSRAEVQQAGIKLFGKTLGKGSYTEIDDAEKIKNTFHLSEEAVQHAAEDAFTRCLNDENAGAGGELRIKHGFSLSDKLLSTPEAQQAAQRRMEVCLTNGSLRDALELKDWFSLPEKVLSLPEIQEAAMRGFIDSINNGENFDINGAIKVKDEFHLPEGAVQGAVADAIVGCLLSGDEESISEALELKNKFSLPEDVIGRAAREGFIKCLADGRIGSALDIRDEFAVSVASEEILKEFPDVKELIDKIDKVSPGLSHQVEKSQDTLISLFQFRGNPEQLLQTIEQCPFLIDAVSENPRMGSKLLVKFPQLDQLSQENITTLFQFKREIMGQDSSKSFNRLSGTNRELPKQTNHETPNLDPESLEFRKLMQEKLKSYKNNPDVLKEAKDNGIDIEQWLNYSDTSYFQLESGAGMAFSETVATPLERIKETIDSYSNRIKEVLSQYRTELSTVRINLEDPKEMQEKINVMQTELEKAKAEGNERKAQGIQKGIDNLNVRMGESKTVSLWDKLMGDIQAFQGLKNDVLSSQERLIETEKQFEEKASAKTPSGKEIQDLKQKMTKLKEELRAKFGILEGRIENFQNNLPELLSPALGKDRIDALVQEIKTGLEEQFNHYDTDRSTLANLFSERTDREKEKMEGQPMSIFVWARNPDTDLYQANYSPCCISIESGCASNHAESAIADYNIDLGIQIVNIWDETKNEPVTAAWCWLGKDGKGNAVLVVDNIESNPMYSINYPEQLTRELFAFLEKYAKSVGAQKLVLGKDNNDLPTGGEIAKLQDDTATYEKIGGYHRDDGYYLEAVDESVKLLWQKKEQAKKERKERRVKPVKFNETEIDSLYQKDFVGLIKMEGKIYPEDLIQGQTLLQEIEDGNGLEYSTVVSGVPAGKKSKKPIGYLVAVEDETDEGNPTVYLEDIAVLPEAQSQGIGWRMVKELVKKLQAKAKKDNKPVLWDMHLRESSQGLLDKHKEELEKMGVKIVEEAFISDHYDEGEDALYRVCEVAVPI